MSVLELPLICDADSQPGDFSLEPRFHAVLVSKGFLNVSVLAPNEAQRRPVCYLQQTGRNEHY